MSISAYSASDFSQFASSADALFSSTASTTSTMVSLAQGAMSNGAALYAKGSADYDKAAQEFKRAIAMDPSAADAPQAFDLLATVYVAQNKTQDAINAYKSSIAIAPSDDNAHYKLGNIYYSQKNYTAAEKEYKTALNLNPTSTTNRFSLGQAYLAEGRYQDAEKQFQQVIRMDPSQYGGYYALGQTYAKEGLPAQAIPEFQKVIKLNKTFYNVNVDLGSAYADLGQMDNAQAQVKILNNKAPNLAPLLTGYIDKVSKPRILTAYGSGGFSSTFGVNTPISADPNTSSTFQMVFTFSKSIDPTSAMDPNNWSISKATPGEKGGAYNWGLPTSSRDLQIPLHPSSVYYDINTATATVSFQIMQNAAGNGTLDPSHIDFKFSGKDTYGNTMDISADQYNGISLIV